MNISTIEQKLMSYFEQSEIKVLNPLGDEKHYEVHVTSNKFNGLNTIEQHRKVYEILGEWVGREIHALSLKTSS